MLSVSTGLKNQDALYHWLRSIETLCKGALRPFTSGIQATHLRNLLLSKASVVMRKSANPTRKNSDGMLNAMGLSAFRCHISGVIGVRASKQVRRITAQRVVAVMTDDKSSGDCTLREFVGKAMGGNRSPICPELSIPATCETTKPKPALGVNALCDLPPESLFRGFLTALRSVTAQVQIWPSFDVAAPTIGLGRNVRSFAASTLAIAEGIFECFHRSLRMCISIPQYTGVVK
jgi:hypothetical protein